MADESKLLLIAPAGAATVTRAPMDREGGEEHGKIKDTVVAIATSINPIDPEKFAERLSSSIANATQVVQEKICTAIGEFSVDEISISLAVTAEGDIGVASAGMEASIEVKLKRRNGPTAHSGGR